MDQVLPIQPYLTIITSLKALSLNIITSLDAGGEDFNLRILGDTVHIAVG